MGDMMQKQSSKRSSVKKVLLEILQNSLKNTRARVSFFSKVAGLWHGCLFSCEFGGISKNTFSYRTPPVAASEDAIKTWEKLVLVLELQWEETKIRKST